MAPPMTAVVRPTRSSCASEAPGFMKRLYRSFDADVESMKRIASQVSTSVENTAASAIAPSHGGSACVSTVGSTAFGSVMSGIATLAIIPNRTGTKAKPRSASRVQRDAGANRASRWRRRTPSESDRAR